MPGWGVEEGGKRWIHLRVSCYLWQVLRSVPEWILQCCPGGPGPLPWAEQSSLAGLIPGSGKAFLPGWPGIQTQTKGGFLSRLFVLLPQSSALCKAKANSTPQLGSPMGSASALPLRCPCLSLPWLLPCHPFYHWVCGFPSLEDQMVA